MFGLFALALGVFGIGIASQSKKASEIFGPFLPFGPPKPDELFLAAWPILNLISSHESGGNYNIVWGGGIKPLTSWTVGQVLDYQRSVRGAGAKSSAVGAYQFIYVTLDRLVTKMRIGKDEIFSRELQDRLAMELLKERGLERFLSGSLSRDQFMYSLSKEWASLPKDSGGLSYYAGDGLNKALVNPKVVQRVLDSARVAYV